MTGIDPSHPYTDFKNNFNHIPLCSAISDGELKDTLKRVSHAIKGIYRTTGIHRDFISWLNLFRLIFSGLFVIAIGIIILTVAGSGLTYGGVRPDIWVFGKPSVI